MNLKYSVLMSALCALVLMFFTSTSQAGEIEDYLNSAGVGAQHSSHVLARAASKSVQNFSGLKQGAQQVKAFIQQSGQLFKRFKWGLIAEGFDVVHALLTGGVDAALAQLAGSLAKLVVEHGIPYVAGVLCSFFGTPVLGTACYWLAKQLVDKLNLGALVEGHVKQQVQQQLYARSHPPAPVAERASPANGAAYNGDIDIQVSTGTVNTQAGKDSTAITEIGVARGGNVDINVSTGNVNTIAKDGSYAYSGIGVANADGAKINTQVGGTVTTQAEDHSSAVSRVGYADDRNANINVGVRDDVNTIAKDQSHAETNIGVADGKNARVAVIVNRGVNTVAEDGGTAQSNVGVADGGRVNVYVKGVNTIADDGSRATSNIGVSSGGSASVSVGGDVNTIAKRGSDASTSIGVNSSVSVRGNVINQGGDLEIGSGCAARRDGQCCIEVHRNYCVLVKVPPSHKGHCPPRFERWGGWCYLYSDKRHTIEK